MKICPAACEASCVVSEARSSRRLLASVVAFGATAKWCAGRGGARTRAHGARACHRHAGLNRERQGVEGIQRLARPCDADLIEAAMNLM
jgi:hypothetical protein